ncbi:MAG: hypothetical protein OEY01_10690 [Desulfobulbaceae bacterium]|nr:hypothetical protein [Desulfobulbaceae bacterium]
MDAVKFLEMLANGGVIVSTGQCHHEEINAAVRDGRMFVVESGLGFIFRPPRGKGPLTPKNRVDRLFDSNEAPTWNEIFDIVCDAEFDTLNFRAVVADRHDVR